MEASIEIILRNKELTKEDKDCWKEVLSEIKKYFVDKKQLVTMAQVRCAAKS